MTVPQALAVVEKAGGFIDVFKAYERALTAMVKLRPTTPIVAHTYCYPLKLGAPADLTIANIGLFALLKKNVGPWIGPHVGKALPALADQRLFARRLIDAFVERVLDPLATDPRFRANFRWLDLRECAPAEDDWFDEMHPQGHVFKRLSEPFAREIRNLFVLR